jgi:hypothetical protein
MKLLKNKAGLILMTLLLAGIFVAQDSTKMKKRIAIKCTYYQPQNNIPYAACNHKNKS